MRARLGYALYLLAIALGLLALFLASANRIVELRSQRVIVPPPAGSGRIVQLPMTMAEGEAYPYPLPPSNVELQGGSVKLIVGGAILVLIVVGGVLYSRTGGKPPATAENQESVAP